MSHPRLYWNADQTALVEEGDPTAATLAYSEGDAISDEHASLAPKAKAETPVPESAAPEPVARKARQVRKPKG